MTLMKTKFLILSLVTIVLTGCINSSTNPSGSSGNTKFEIYSDKTSFYDGDLEFRFVNLYEYRSSESYSVYFSLELVSRNIKPTTFEFEKPLVLRESNNAEYSVSGYVMNHVNLECDIKKSISFSSTIPISISKEKYSFNLKYGSKEIVYHLYETPDELRTKINVKFVVDNELVETKQIPEGRSFKYIWTSSDYIYGCKDWFLDVNCHNKLPDNYNVSEDMSVYGKKISVLKYQLPSGISASYVSGYNLVPESGEIVIPRSYGGKSVYSILAYSFYGECYGLKAIYIPATAKISSSGNFSSCVDLEYVYFEGTEDEWLHMNEAAYSEKTQIVFNTYK